jgi:hypothetical protein
MCGASAGFLSAATNLVTSNARLQQAYVRDTCFAALSPSSYVPLRSLLRLGRAREPNAAASAISFASNSCNGAFVSSRTDVLSGVTAANQI